MAETSTQSKKFFTENRIRTATTRSQTGAPESLADIKDFRTIVEINMSSKKNVL